MANFPISDYISLLDIRLKASRRNVTISGSIFLITLFGFFALGMLEIPGNQRAIYLSGMVLTFFGLSFITTLVRYEVMKSASELARVISRAEEMA